MKKFLSLMLVVLMLMSVMTITMSATQSKTQAPDWMITKIAADTADINGTYPSAAANSTGEIFEAFEIVNISGKTLNLYEYGLAYNGNSRTHANFEGTVTKFTPFKAGDYRDDTTTSWPNMPTNPDTCMVAPGEVVVIWNIYLEPKWESANWNGNASISDFRKHWNIPASVKVIAVDGNSEKKIGGTSENFGIRNQHCTSYAIAKIDGMVVNTTTFEDVISWSNLDFKDEISAVANQNHLAVFGYDATSSDVRRAKLLDYSNTVQLGVLTAAQKASFGSLLPSTGEDTTTPDTDAPETTPTPGATTGFDPILMLLGGEYDITASAAEGGMITPAGVTKVRYKKDAAYTITPNEGYAIADVLVDGESVGAVSTYTFEYVRKDHAITALFVKTAWESPYTDVAELDWFFEDVKYVTETGLMSGLPSDLFAPDLTANRAMIVTILWRMEGSPAAASAVDFFDVPAGEWYADAVQWAAANGIVLGSGDGTFNPDSSITREQLTAMLHRYAVYKGWDDGLALPMIPQRTCSVWAENDVNWADKAGLLDGIAVSLSDMTQAASRAEVAAMLRRLCER